MDRAAPANSARQESRPLDPNEVIPGALLKVDGVACHGDRALDMAVAFHLEKTDDATRGPDQQGELSAFRRPNCPVKNQATSSGPRPGVSLRFAGGKSFQGKISGASFSCRKSRVNRGQAGQESTLRASGNDRLRLISRGMPFATSACSTSLKPKEVASERRPIMDGIRLVAICEYLNHREVRHEVRDHIHYRFG